MDEAQKLKELQEKVTKKTTEYEDEQKKKQETVSYSKILLTFADGTDIAYLTVGWIASIVTGVAMPSFVFLFGNIVDDYASADDLVHAISKIAVEFTLIGVGVWITSYFYYAMLVIMAERIGRSTKVAYLKSILQQEVGWFD